MYLKTIKIWNFRCFGSKKNNEPGVEIDFDPKLNLLIGPNDSGKTAIIDAIRYVLGTQTFDPVRLEDEDFHEENLQRANDLKIECIFSGFNEIEAGQFLEWININKEDIKKSELRVWLTAQRKNNRIITNLRAGYDDEGQYIEGEARDLLRVTYLKPLRDAETELTPGYRSRLAQILKSHSLLHEKINEKHPLVKYFDYSNKKVKEYFDADKLTANSEIGITADEQGGKEIKDKFKEQTKTFLELSDSREPFFEITPAELNAILRKLELSLEKNKSGLGTLNQLFMAAEMIHLKRENYTGLRLGLIEELEAHLHPQAQLRVLKSLINDNTNNIQYILTTHSTILGSSIPLKYLKLCSNNNVYSLDKDNTQLSESDYQFLERFLDATKANLFFAKGVIFVEGDAENIIVPVIAEIIGKPLYKYGVSVVNVGHKGFFRYVNIFKRKDGTTLPIKVSIITDLDINVNDNGKPTETEQGIELKRQNIKNEYESSDGNIKVFTSPLKTLEFDIACGNLYWYMHKAIQIAKKCQSNWINDNDIQEILSKIDEILEEKDINKRACKIFESLDKKQASKPITAQWFSKFLLENIQVATELINKDLNDNKGIKYIVYAINHVTG